MSRAFYFFLPFSPLTLHMSWGQRLSALLHTISQIACVTLAISIIILPISIFPAHNDKAFQLVSNLDRSRLKKIFLVAYLMHKLNRYMLYGRVGLKNIAYQARNKIWSAPCEYADVPCTPLFLNKIIHLVIMDGLNPLPCIMEIPLVILPWTDTLIDIAYQTIWSSIPRLDNFHFEASGSVVSKAEERSKIRRQPLLLRLSHPTILMHISYVLLATLPLLVRIVRYITSTADGGMAFFPLTGPLLKLLQCIYHFGVPIHYMIFPPTVPERSELIITDANGINRPRSTKLKASKNGFSWAELLDLAIILLNDWA